MTTTPEEFHKLIEQNALRLSEDATVLRRKRKWRSAIAVGVLAIEELGKSLIEQWGVRNLGNKRTHPSHIEKQSATFALLSADELLADNGKLLRKAQKRGDRNLSGIGSMTDQFLQARNGFYEDLRMFANYTDKTPKFSTIITAQNGRGISKELHFFFRKAVLARKRAASMKLAATLYKMDLGRM